MKQILAVLIMLGFILSCGKDEAPCETRKAVKDSDNEYLEKDSLSAFKNQITLEVFARQNITEYTGSNTKCIGVAFGTIDLKIKNLTNRAIVVKAFPNLSDYNAQINFITISVPANGESNWQDVSAHYGNYTVPLDFIIPLLRVEYK